MTAKERREQRLAVQLRANLKRRKLAPAAEDLPDEKKRDPGSSSG